jgi:sugar O-acyltransferase (sialic acid O-acetyltransferase NeuD family)
LSADPSPLGGSPRKLILVGDSAFAEVAFEYFTHESQHEVVAFAVEREYLRRNSLFGLPVVPFEDLPSSYAPAEHSFFAAIVYTDMNSLRRRLYSEAKRLGYAPASFVSPRAFVWRNCKLGEHCFIFEDNVIQPFVEIGDDVVLWSGNHIGHHSRIGSHCFLASHVVVSGFVGIGESCFLGVNSTVVQEVRIGDRCLVGAGALVLGDVPPDQKVVGVWKRSSS